MHLRTPYQPYLSAVSRYFTELFKVLVPLQSMYGGPIIAFQIENEFAHHPHVTVAEAQEYMTSLYHVSMLCHTHVVLCTNNSSILCIVDILCRGKTFRQLPDYV